MSLANDGQHIECDGDGCSRRARVPVGLRQVLGTGNGANVSAVSGWLYVSRDGRYRHFCSQCSAKYLNALQSVGDAAFDNRR